MFHIRPMQSCQRPALRRFYHELRRRHFVWRDAAELASADFDRDTADEMVLVASGEQGELLGFVSLWQADSFVHHLYIADAARGQGIGRALLAAAGLFCREAPTLKCDAANLEALAFYRRLGWQQSGEGVEPGGQRWLQLRGPLPPVRFSEDVAQLDQARVYRYLSEDAYWSRGLPREIFEASLAGSMVIGGYAPDGRQLAFARVISDHATFAYLGDVFVFPEAQGQGIGKALMQYIDLHPRLQNLRRFMLATADAHGLYAQYGFVAPARPERLMERCEPDIYQRLAAARATSP